MRILETHVATLSNAEVFAHLKSLTAKHQAQAAKPGTVAMKSPNFETVAKELHDYLAPSEQSPLPDYSQNNYNAEATRRLFSRLAQYKFTKAEMVMIMNLRPASRVVLDCVVEECEERFTEETQDRILEIIAEVLEEPGDPAPVMDEGSNGSR